MTKLNTGCVATDPGLGDDGHPMFERHFVVESAPYKVIQGAVEPEVCDALVQLFRDHPEFHAGVYELAKNQPGVDRFTSFPVPADFKPTLHSLALLAGAAMRLPVNPAVGFYGMGRYLPGGLQGWHYDANPTDPKSLDRTVSFSLLLSEPGVDFEGGELEFVDGPVELHKGDMACFTARTCHQVREVTKGERFVVICFSSFPRGAQQ